MNQIEVLALLREYPDSTRAELTRKFYPDLDAMPYPERLARKQVVGDKLRMLRKGGYAESYGPIKDRRWRATE